MNPSAPKHFIYTDYIDKYKHLDKQGVLQGGYNYQSFTIFDNQTISESKLQSIMSQYEVGSLWYRRDILGERVNAEGAIYRIFTENKDKILVDSETRLGNINIGVDFGGSKSAHAFVAAKIGHTGDYVTYLATERHDAAKINPDMLGWLFCDFVRRVQSEYGAINAVYADSAEQTLIKGLRASLEKDKIYGVSVLNSWKQPIVDRIRLTTSLMAQGRLNIIEKGCKTLIDALDNALWNETKFEDVRLDDGTSDIDTLDAAEYAIEPYINLLQNFKRVE